MIQLTTASKYVSMQRLDLALRSDQIWTADDGLT